MKRRVSILSVLLVICFLFLLVSPAAGAASGWPNITPAYWDNIEGSLDAYFKMLDQIAPTQQNYPHSYGGAYIDPNGRLNIQIVESAKDTADYVPDTAIVWYVKYSLNELRGTLGALSDASRTNPALFGTNDVTGLYVDEKLNCVFVELVETEKPVDQAYEQRIASAFGGSDLVRFTYTSAYREEAIAPGDLAKGNLLNGTVGFPAENYFTGEEGFVTAAHLTSGIGATVTVNGVAGTVTQRQLGGSVDACFVTVPNATNYLTSDFSMDGNVGKLIAANQYDYPAGTTVYKAGQATRFKEGVITATDFISDPEGEPVLQPLYRINFETGGTAPGDSGAPVFVSLGGPAKIFIGIHVRGNGTYSSSCKYIHIRNALSVNLYVD